MADELNPKYVPEVDESIGPAAREAGAWVGAYPKTQMDNFAAVVKKNASSASASATNATTAAKATAADVGRAKEAVVAAAQKADVAASQAELAAVEVQKATLQALLATEKAVAATDEADRATEAADRAARIVDEFNPWINQYGYSKVVTVSTPEYRVTEADVGKTLLFTQTARLILPASSRATFPEFFFFHVTTVNETDRVWIDYDLATTLTLPEWHLPCVNGCERGTIQLLAAGKWRLYNPIIRPAEYAFCAKTAQSWNGQSHGQTHVRENLDGDHQYALTKQFGNLYAWGLDLVGGAANSAVANALKVIDLPDGPLEFIYSSQEHFTGKLLFGVYGAYETLTTHFGWYWADSGFTGNVYPLTFEGYLPSNWYITDLKASVATGVKHLWVEFSSRTLKKPDGAPVTHSRVFTSTDGYSWFVNRYGTVNAKIGLNRLIAHFPQEDAERGDLYVELVSTGEVVKYSYAITPGTWTEEVIADGYEELVLCKYWSATRSYGLVLRDSGMLTFVIHSSVYNSTKIAEYETPVRSVTRVLGDSPRVPGVCALKAGGSEATLIQWVVGEASPNGRFLETPLCDTGATEKNDVLAHGTFVKDQSTVVTYVVHRNYSEATTTAWVNGQSENLPWNDCDVLAVGKISGKYTGFSNTVFTDLGLHFDLSGWQTKAAVTPEEPDEPVVPATLAAPTNLGP